MSDHGPDSKAVFDRRVTETLEAARRRRLYAIHDAVPEPEPEEGRLPKAVEGGSGPDARRAGPSDGSRNPYFDARHDELPPRASINIRLCLICAAMGFVWGFIVAVVVR